METKLEFNIHNVGETTQFFITEKHSNIGHVTYGGNSTLHINF
jgi:hypothetical protein